MSGDTHFWPGWAQGKALRDTLELKDSRPFHWAVRAGFVARGLTYALIGAIAIALSVGAGSKGTVPNQQGALSLIAAAPLGRGVLAAAAVGLAAYALWKLALAVLGIGPEGAAGQSAFDRIANLAGSIVYLSFCALAVEVILGSAGSQAREQRHTAGGVLRWPAGRVLVAVAGCILVAISLHQIYVGARTRFARDSKVSDMGSIERRSFLILGRIGLIARALVFGLCGYFLARTAVDFKVSRGIGVDGTLAEIHAQAYGNVLLVLVGIGLLVFAAFSLLEARRRRL